MALDNDGKLWSICTTPKRLWQSSSFVHCDGGVRHAAAVTSDGKCLCWGRHGLKVCGGVGDVGAGQGGASSQAIQCGMDETSAGCENAVLWWPTDGAKIIKVACGWRFRPRAVTQHSYHQLHTLEEYTCTHEITIQCTACHPPALLSEMSFPHRHSAAVDDRGRVWTFGGSNKHGQLGKRRVECRDGEPAPVQDVDGAVHLSAGWSHTLVQLRDGRILTFGRGAQRNKTPYASNGIKHGMPDVCVEIEPNTASFPPDTCSRHAAHSRLTGDKGQLGRRLDRGRRHDSIAGSVRTTEGSQACSGQPGAAWLGGTTGSEQILLVSADGDLWASGWNEHGSETPKGPDLS